MATKRSESSPRKPRTDAQRNRERILEAAQALNYTPNYMARSLRRTRSMSIGILAWAYTLLLPSFALAFVLSLGLTLASRATARRDRP